MAEVIRRGSPHAQPVGLAKAAPPRLAVRESRLFPIADALLAAARADKRVMAQEKEAIRAALCQLLGADKLPERLAQRLQAFDPERLDIDLLARQLVADPLL